MKIFTIIMILITIGWFIFLATVVPKYFFLGLWVFLASVVINTVVFTLMRMFLFRR